MIPNYFQNSNIIWVAGEEGAKQYPSMNAILMDSQEKTFYIKSTDASGMPLPLRIFDYSERVAKPVPQNNENIIAREDVEKMIADLKEEFEEKLTELSTKKPVRKEKTDE